jgi:nicotinamide-nucleotide amidase
MAASHAQPPLAEIIAVGDELLQGWNTDTNSGEIARELLACGVRCVRFAAVGDVRNEIRDALLAADERADVVIVTGGLGPTLDDLTREGAADAMGVAMEWVEENWIAIQERLRKRNPVIPESNKRQAWRPEGSTSIPNSNGTAPGVALELRRAAVYLLPGVPREMRPMLQETVIPDIRRRFPAIRPMHRRVLKCFGASEAAVGEMIGKWMASRDADPLVGITVSNAIHTISVLASSESAAESTASEIAAGLGPLVYARKNDTLESVVGELLIHKKKSVAFAESCTGGLASALLGTVPGISSVWKESFVTYSNDSKVARLGVDRALLERHGAVSAECALAMAEGARRAARTDYAVAITGIAGPGGGTAGKPVGLVYFALAHDGAPKVLEKHYAKLGRNVLREVAAREALNLLRLSLLEKN